MKESRKAKPCGFFSIRSDEVATKKGIVAGMKKFSTCAAWFSLTACVAASAFALAQTTAATAPTKDSSYIDAQGTAHVTRVVPIPQTLSPEAQRSLARSISDAPQSQ